MIKSKSLKLLSILFVVVLIFAAMTTFGIAAKKEKVQEWIIASEGGVISLKDVTITFGANILQKDTKIHIIYLGEGEYQFGPEIEVNAPFTVFFADAAELGVTTVFTFKQGEWIELTCIDGIIETDHFSRYRGSW